MAKQSSLKRIQISKANTTMVASIAISAFVVVFSLVASQALWNKRGFQSRLIAEKEVAVAQLNTNLETVDELVVAYTAFTETGENVIGGNPEGTGDRDGDNAKITLDALPSKYDFPALATSLEKLLKNDYQEISISGEDEEASRSAEGQAIEPVEMPFEISATASSDKIKDLLVTLQRSIRPMNIISVDISGSNSDLQTSISAKTYYQPEKAFNVQTKVVK
jgi:hypothetical protein